MPNAESSRTNGRKCKRKKAYLNAQDRLKENALIEKKEKIEKQIAEKSDVSNNLDNFLDKYYRFIDLIMWGFSPTIAASKSCISNFNADTYAEIMKNEKVQEYLARCRLGDEDVNREQVLRELKSRFKDATNKEIVHLVRAYGEIYGWFVRDGEKGGPVNINLNWKQDPFIAMPEDKNIEDKFIEEFNKKEGDEDALASHSTSGDDFTEKDNFDFTMEPEEPEEKIEAEEIEEEIEGEEVEIVDSDILDPDDIFKF